MILGAALAINDAGQILAFGTRDNGFDTRLFLLTPVTDLALAKTASSATVPAGGDVTFTLTLSNTAPGAFNATNVVVADTLPTGLTPVSCAATGGGACAAAGNGYTITFPSLAAGATETVTIVARTNADAANGVVYTNTATITGTGQTADSNEGNNTATADVTVFTPPPAVSFALALTQANSGGCTGTVAADPAPNAPSGRYTEDTVVTLTAAPAAGCVFAGWRVDSDIADPDPDVAYFANPFTITLNSDRAVQASFARQPVFSDVAPSDPAYGAISQLAAAGIIRGFDPATCARLGRAHPCFGPDQRTVRAQIAALITRAIGRDGEEWGSRFTDTGGVDLNLRRNINTLAHYDIARGFPEPVCESQRVGFPCFLPFEPVLGAQVISFITRAMVTEGIWEYQPDNAALYPNVPADSGHRIDLATYVHYVGDVPNNPRTAPFAGYNQPSTRAFFAQALLKALSYDRTP